MLNKAARVLSVCLALVLLSCAWPVPAPAEETTIIRVGWYDTPYNRKDALNRRSGYAYEYQRKIAAVGFCPDALGAAGRQMGPLHADHRPAADPLVPPAGGAAVFPARPLDRLTISRPPASPRRRQRRLYEPFYFQRKNVDADGAARAAAGRLPVFPV